MVVALKTTPIMKKNKIQEEINMAVQTKGYNIEQVVDVIEMLSYSQGFYGRLLDEIMYIEENEPDKYEVFKTIIEAQEFKDPVDVVMFFEGQVETSTWSLLFHLFAMKTTPIMRKRRYGDDHYKCATGDVENGAALEGLADGYRGTEQLKG